MHSIEAHAFYWSIMRSIEAPYILFDAPPAFYLMHQAFYLMHQAFYLMHHISHHWIVLINILHPTDV